MLSYLSQDAERPSYLRLQKGIPNPALPEILTTRLRHFKNNLGILEKSSELLNSALAQFIQQSELKRDEIMASLDFEGFKQLHMWLNFRDENVDSIEITDQKVAEALDLGMQYLRYKQRVPMFLAEMGLVYVIVAFEEFLKDTLESVFNHRPEILRTSKKMMSAEEILDLKDFENIREKIIEKELSAIVSEDPERIASYLKKHHKLELDRLTDWQQFKETFYRRHIIIHNNCYPDDNYKRKTGYSGAYDRLSVDNAYLQQSMQLCVMYATRIHDHFVEKFKDEK